LSGNGINDSLVDGSYEPENPAADDTIVHEDDPEYDNAYRNLFIGEFLMGFFCITNGFYFRIMVISTTGIVLLYMLLLSLEFLFFFRSNDW
jgi:hypothetical protein